MKNTLVLVQRTSTLATSSTHTEISFTLSAKELVWPIVPNHVLVRSHLKENLKIMDMKHEVVSGKFCIVYHQEAKELKRIKATIDHLIAIKNPLSINLI